MGWAIWWAILIIALSSIYLRADEKTKAAKAHHITAAIVAVVMLGFAFPFLKPADPTEQRIAELEREIAALNSASPKPPSAPAATQSGVQACVTRGIAYFREIESWPTLSDGRSASTVAQERCRRITTAF